MKTQSTPIDLTKLPRAITSRADLRIFLEMDLLAHNLQTWRFRDRFTRPELSFQRRLRYSEYWRTHTSAIGRLIYVVQRKMLLNQSVRTGISIPPGVCGPGLSIAHYGSVVVNADARIGAFCRLHSATNIGAFAGHAPNIGDFVYIGPGAVIFGEVEVGSKTVIGANAVVDKDIPASHIAVGAPAKHRPAEASRSPMPAWIQSIMHTN